MTSPDTTSFDPSRALTASDFHESASAVSKTALVRATDRYVGIDHENWK
ncbi:hypothetical protein ACFFQF_13050 [Haladaptatus pallidirubidus]|nr:hypothetical protein [Haladaptatus pallidirubidus]